MRDKAVRSKEIRSYFTSLTFGTSYKATHKILVLDLML